MQLVKSDNSTLKQISTEWDFKKDGDAKSFEIDMVQAMVEHRGLGLAANQVGIPKRVFAIQLKDQVPFCMFNPRVVIVGDDEPLVEGDEGCLSFPGLFLKVKRYNWISVEYFDRMGQKCIMELTGIDARCFLHELDHLNGVCFTDKVSPLKLALAKKKQLKRKRNG